MNRRFFNKILASLPFVGLASGLFQRPKSSPKVFYPQHSVRIPKEANFRTSCSVVTSNFDGDPKLGDLMSVDFDSRNAKIYEDGDIAVGMCIGKNHEDGTIIISFNPGNPYV